MIGKVLSIFSRENRDKATGRKRSSRWQSVRAGFIQGKACAACGATKNLNVHHVLPFHLHPELELEPDNLIVLCENKIPNCHYHFGHNALSWSCYNPSVRVDAATFLTRRNEAKTS